MITRSRATIVITIILALSMMNVPGLIGSQRGLGIAQGQPTSQYPVTISYLGVEMVFFANHTSNLENGNWIELSGGSTVELPTMSAVYNGPDIDYPRGLARLRMESSFIPALTYPLDTHQVYKEGDTVSATFWGSTDFGGKSVDFMLLRGSSLSDIRDALDEGFLKIRETLLYSLVNLPNSEITLNSAGDGTYEFTAPAAGDYILVVAKSSLFTLHIYSATAIEIVDYTLDVSAVSSVVKGTDLNIEATLSGDPSGSYIYGFAMIDESSYYGNIRLESTGTIPSTELYINNILMAEGDLFTDFYTGTQDQSDLNITLIEEKLNMVLDTDELVFGHTTETNPGSIPLSTSSLTPGEYILLVGVWNNWNSRIVGLNQTRVTVNAPSETGTLSIATTPVNGEVFVDGTSWGTAPQSRVVAVGSYTVSFGAVSGYTTPASQVADVTADTITTITGTYVETVIPPDMGTLSIATTPVAGEVSVNGVSWGTAPQSQVVAVGSYTVSFGTVSGYTTPASQVADVTADTITTITGTYVETVIPPVNTPPVADAGTDRTALLGVPASFDGSGSTDSDGTIVSYAWTFGDGGTGTGISPSHTYTSAGTYTVSLTVRDDDGGTGSDSLTVTVEEEATPDVIEDLPPDEAADIIEDMDPTEAADIIEEMNATAAADVIEEVSTEAAADIVEEMNVTSAADVVEEMNVTSAADVIEVMNVTSAADIIEEVPTEAAADIVEEMNVTSAADVIEVMNVTSAADIIEEVPTEAAADIVEEMNVMAAAEVIVEVEIEEAADIIEEMTDDAAVYVLVEVDTSSAATIMEAVEEEEAGDLINSAVQTDSTDQFSDIMLEMEENATAGALLASEPESGAEFVETMANKDLTRTAERVEAAVKLRARELEPEAQEELLSRAADMLEEVSVESLVALFMEIITLPATPSTIATVFEVMDLGKVLEVVEAWIDLEAYEGLATVFDLLTQEPLVNIWLGMASADRAALYPYLSEETIASLPSLAVFQVSELTVTPQQVKTGENVTISATVTNIGEESGEYTAILKVDGVTEETETVTLTVDESTTISFTVSRTVEGVYTVEVDGQTGSFTVELAPPEPPVADAGDPYTVQVDISLTFDGRGSYDPDGTIEVYAWDFGDGGTGEGPTPSHIYSSTGTYDVNLTVTDNDGLTDSNTTTVTVEEPKPTPPAYVGTPNKSPVAEAGPDQTIYVDEIVEFSGANSIDPDGTIVNYEWDFGDGEEASGVNASHAYSEPGNYTVTLTVRDNRYREASDTCTITVRETPPIIIPPLPPILSDLTITPEEIELGDDVTIGLDIENIDSQSITYTVTMQIGELTLLVDVELEAYESTTVSRTLTPDTVGDYNVIVDGLTGSFTVIPVPPPPTPPRPAEFVASDLSITPEEADIGEEVEIRFTVTNIGELPGDYSFTLGIEGPLIVVSTDITGSLETGESEIASYKLTQDVPGTYSVEVDGLRDSFTVKTPPKPAEFEFSGLEVTPLEVEEGLAVTVTLEVSNVGEELGSHTVELKVDGYVVDSQELTLEGGETVTVFFELTRDEGTHQVEVEGMTDQFTVYPSVIPIWMRPGTIAGIIIIIIAAAAILYAYWKGILPTIYPEIDDKIE